MGYYYNWVAREWQPKDHSLKWTRERACRVGRRAELINGLLMEIERGHDSITSLYANLLARALVQTDEKLMDQFGKQVTEDQRAA